MEGVIHSSSPTVRFSAGANRISQHFWSSWPCYIWQAKISQYDSMTRVTTKLWNRLASMHCIFSHFHLQCSPTWGCCQDVAGDHSYFIIVGSAFQVAWTQRHLCIPSLLSTASKWIRCHSYCGLWRASSNVRSNSWLPPHTLCQATAHLACLLLIYYSKLWRCTKMEVVIESLHWTKPDRIGSMVDSF
jgi:hypothetical protein